MENETTPHGEPAVSLPGQTFQSIKVDRAIDVDSERLIPATIVAHAKGKDFESTIYRVGERYYKKIEYFNLQWLADHLRDPAWEKDAKELMHLVSLLPKESIQLGQFDDRRKGQRRKPPKTKK